MNKKERETIQKVVGFLWALSYGKGFRAVAINDAADILIGLLEEDENHDEDRH